MRHPPFDVMHIKYPRAALILVLSNPRDSLQGWLRRWQRFEITRAIKK